MNDLAPVEPDTSVEPISASADGKRNAYTLQCDPCGTSMNYAACLWRQNVLADSSIKTPADWSPCGQARAAGTCIALSMRKEEELAGKALYFKDRGLVRRITDAVTRWIMPSITPKLSPARPEPARRSGSMLDAMGAAGDFADAVSIAAKTPASAPPSARATRPIPVMANTGESPLQMARRIAAERVARG